MRADGRGPYGRRDRFRAHQVEEAVDFIGGDADPATAASAGLVIGNRDRMTVQHEATLFGQAEPTVEGGRRDPERAGRIAGRK